jgi:hypothetical protein
MQAVLNILRQLSTPILGLHTDWGEVSAHFSVTKDGCKQSPLVESAASTCPYLIVSRIQKVPNS